jgi:hypothetical protein
VDDLKMIADLLTEPPPAEEVVVRGRTRLISLAREPRPRVSRRALAGTIAAGVLIAGGTAYGISTRLPGSPAHAGSRAPAVARLTAVRGCPGLYASAGTLERVTGTSLVIRSAVTGHSLTVTTSSATRINRQAAGALSDITDGARVFVAGSGMHRPALAAGWAIIGLDLLKPGNPIHHRQPGGHPGIGNVAAGTVADAHAGGFTVITGSGMRVPVTMSGSTTILTLEKTSIGGLRTGELVDAVGNAGPDGTLAATTIDQGTDLPVASSPPGALGCSPSVVATALLAAAHAGAGS